MRLEGKKVAVLVAADFEDLEFWVPVMRLREEGAQVTIFGAKGHETYLGKHGVPAKTDATFEDAQSAHFDALVIPGGWAPDKLRRYEPVKRLVREMNSAGKIIGMICHAGLVGISAGIVRGGPATGSEGIKDDLVNAGAEWLDKPAFRHQNIVWGRVVEDIPDFCRELVQAIEGG
ncbi:MAG TPA: type 1 glutamine amidotransferase domain-containing protein [Anaerolineaceae bacterium]|nr:type 1 glutamine amidotransferase domain-containing protein [Anaerolineaceae bacterium]